MNNEQLKELRRKTDEVREGMDLLANMKKLVADVDEDVEVRVRGFKIKLPKGLFVSEVQKKINEKEKSVNRLSQELRQTLRNF